jgi:hypothetical protein
VLIDALLPHCDFMERHETRVRATPERVYAVIRETDFSRSAIIRLLTRLRGMRGRGAMRVESGFHVIADEPPRELVIGLEGPFWKPACKLRDIDAATFRTPVPHDVARAAWNFFLERRGDETHVVTETRVLCGDGARAKFRLYWLFIRPFSGLIRRAMLRQIRIAAES